MNDEGSDEGSKEDLIKYRTEQADETLAEGRLLLEQGHVRGAVNRAYYSVFYIIQALLTSSSLSTSKHYGAIALFDREYVKTGIFRKELSAWLHELFDSRQDSDYGKKIVIPLDQARQYLFLAESFVVEVKNYLGKIRENGKSMPN